MFALRYTVNSRPMDYRSGIEPIRNDCPVWLDWLVRAVAVASIGFAVWIGWPL